MSTENTDLWPSLTYADFAPSRHLLHMMLQVVGKLKLSGPFHAQWAEVGLLITPRGLTTGPIPCPVGAYELRLDFIDHEIAWFTSAGAVGKLALGPTSVARFTSDLLDGLRRAGIDPTINMMPQEVPNPLAFDRDIEQRAYDPAQVNRWWRILLAVHRVMYAFQGRFTGRTRPIGLMWGTMDIRLVLYNGKPATPAKDAGFIRRNAMNAELIEMGWWAGDPSYEKPAFYAFTYPQPAGIESAKISPDGAGWSAKMGEFLMDYDTSRESGDADAALMSFLETTYEAGAKAAGWNPALLGDGKPV